MRSIAIITAALAVWLLLSPNCQAEFTLEMRNEGNHCEEPSEGSCSEIPWRKTSSESSGVNVPAPTLPESNHNVDSYMGIDGSPDVVKGEDGKLRSGAQAATELNNEAVRRMNEGKFDEAKSMLEKAKEIMGEAPEGPCFEETQLNKFNRNVINQNVDTVYKYDADRYDKSSQHPSVEDVMNSLEPGSVPSSDCSH